MAANLDNPSHGVKWDGSYCRFDTEEEGFESPVRFPAQLKSRIQGYSLTGTFPIEAHKEDANGNQQPNSNGQLMC
jgi:hypothetical protein